MTTIEKAALKRPMYDAQNGRCYWCNRQMRYPRIGKMVQPIPRDMATFDHVIPLSRGGSDDRSNLVLACHDCNVKNRNTTPAERWGKAL